MFSEKYGYKKQKTIQHENVSDELRNRIWNLFYQSEIKDGGLSSKRLSLALNGGQTIEEKIVDRFGLLINCNNKSQSVEERLKERMVKLFRWYEVYDFIDIHLSYLENDERNIRIGQYNEILEQEKAGYRIVSGEIAPITNTEEIKVIEQSADTEFLSVNQHIKKALNLYADIQEPDYENSIKESISAVEAMCCIITGLSGANATLGKAIKKLKDNGVHIHSAMEQAFLSLYGYTSDEDGIRHGGIDFNNAPAEDAKYMLVSCSAFVNYLIEKYVEAQMGE
ncbi:MAG: hypothetical protein NC180_10575 [Muribaculaceae bacterium]|nr:hypothetical protein [Muribaculaceae bacterium]MCM1560209.1 hypothetical protein [Butyrivibrio sp.]